MPLNSWWRSDELKYGVEHSELKLLFVDEKRYQYTQDLDVLQVLKTDSPSETITFSDVLQNACTDWPVSASILKNITEGYGFRRRICF